MVSDLKSRTQQEIMAAGNAYIHGRQDEAAISHILGALKAIDERLELVEHNVREIGRHASFL